MKIMTFNVQHFLDYKNQIIDLSLFSEAIKACGADICGLNEVRGQGVLEGYTDQANGIGELLGFNRCFGEAIKVKGENPYGNALVSRYEIKSVETHIIPDPEIKDGKESYETRCILKTVLDIEGKELCVLVCHMGLNNGERVNAVEAVCALLDGIDIPVILMGDFNSTPEDEVFLPIRERLNDTDELSEEKDMATYPSDRPEIKIDYIFYRGLECKNVKTITEIYSDHFPIIAEFEF